MSLWQTQIITIRTVDGPRLVEADVFGCFGVHRRHSGRKHAAWRITHLPSGLGLGNVTGDFSSPDAAKRTVEALARRFNDVVLWGDDGRHDHRERAEVVRAFIVGNRLAGDIEAPKAPACPERSIRMNGYQAGVQ